MESLSIPMANRRTGGVAGRCPTRAKTRAMAKERPKGARTKARPVAEAPSEIGIELETFGRQALPRRSSITRSRSTSGCATPRGAVAE